MKVLKIIDTLNVGGAERMFVESINLLEQKKIDVSYLLFNSEGELENKINSSIIKEKYTRYSKFSLLSAKELSVVLNKYDIIHIHMRHVFRYVKLVSLIFNCKVKLILHDHSNKTEKLPFLLKSVLKPKFYIGVSKEVTNWFTLKARLKKENVFILKNTVVRDLIMSVDNKNDLVLVSNIKPEKNQLFAIKLIKKLNINLTIIGKIQNKEYFKVLEKEIDRLNLKNNITFLHKITNIQPLLSSFKLGLHTSKKESGPLVLVEYLAQNLPFLAYKTGEVSETINKEEPLFFLNSFDEEKWVSKIKTLLDTNFNSIENIYNRNFSPEKYVNTCIKIYQKILAS